MTENIISALKIMGQGMAGIFAAILIIMLVMILVRKLDQHSDKK